VREGGGGPVVVVDWVEVETWSGLVAIGVGFGKRFGERSSNLRWSWKTADGDGDGECDCECERSAPLTLQARF
jgi:hypothetical protein